MPSASTAPDPTVTASSSCDHDRRHVVVIASTVSIAALLLYRADVLLYGDAVAHIGNARRIIDSVTPGLGQLGTVWLPLPHLLILPFVARLSWWQAGMAASIPSMVAYVFATAGIYTLFRELFHHRAGACLAAFVFAANPNLVYLQTTAMTEPLYLALFVWAVVWLTRLVAALSPTHIRPDRPVERSDAAVVSSNDMRARRALMRCAFLLCAAELTRYDGWVLSGVVVAIAWFAWLRARARGATRLPTPAFALFVVIVGLGPMFWFWWNFANTRNPLDFANGPYSARGIEQRVKSKVDARAHPGESEPWTALRIYVHAVEVNFGEKRWGPTLFWAAAAGALLVVGCAAARGRSAGVVARNGLPLGETRARPAWLALILWLPLPFYAYSIAYGSVPIFTPFRWPFSYYNVRYGLEALPAIAIFAAVLVRFAVRLASAPRTRALAVALAFVFCSAAYLSCFWQQPNRPKSLLPDEPWLGPIVWREAKINAATRLRYETALGTVLSKLPPDSTLLMYTGDHVGALQRAGIRLARVTNESNFYPWRLALVSPGAAADYVVAAAGDPVTAAVSADPEELAPLATIDVAGQPHTIVYRSTRRDAPAAGAPEHHHAH